MEVHQKNFTLHKISADESARAFLAKQGLAMENVLTEGNKAYLHNKIILKCGADIHDKTDNVHPDNIALFQKISRLCDTPLVGLDFICQDISQPHRKQKCVNYFLLAYWVACCFVVHLPCWQKKHLCKNCKSMRKK